MKKTLTILMLAATVATQAQTEQPAAQDTTKITLGKAELLIVDKEGNDSTITWENDDPKEKRRIYRQQLTYWSGVDVGFNMLRTADGSTTMKGDNDWLDIDYSSSLIWRLNLLEEKVNLIARDGKPILGLAIGAGFTYSSYGLANNVRVVANPKASADTTFGIIDTTMAYSFSKNKMRMSYIQVPLLLEVNTSTDPDKNFHIAAGVIGGWNMGTIIKQKWNFEGKDHKDRTKGDFNATPFTLDLTARIGYRNLSVFGTYSLTPLFQKGQGPEVYPMSFGVAFTFGEDQS